MQDSMSIAHSPNRYLSKLYCPIKSTKDVAYSLDYIYFF